MDYMGDIFRIPLASLDMIYVWCDSWFDFSCNACVVALDVHHTHRGMETIDLCS
jgi:hypothetical protein